MGITCPACNKADQADPSCARCGCDLALLHAIVEAASARLRAAEGALAAGDYRRALRHAGQSWRLWQSQDSAGLAFVAAAALGESGPALRWHRRADVSAG